MHWWCVLSMLLAILRKLNAETERPQELESIMGIQQFGVGGPARENRRSIGKDIEKALQQPWQ
jgi:hypothetical protein